MIYIYFQRYVQHFNIVISSIKTHFLGGCGAFLNALTISMETKQIQSSMTLNITSFLHSPKPSVAINTSYTFYGSYWCVQTK